MKQRILITAGGPRILNPNEGGFMPIYIPSYERPDTLFGVPVANIRQELIEPMLQPGTQCYADVDFDPPEDDPNIAAIFGFYSENEPGPVSISNLEIAKVH